jgi:hypothetical protein
VNVPICYPLKVVKSGKFQDLKILDQNGVDVLEMANEDMLNHIATCLNACNGYPKEELLQVSTSTKFTGLRAQLAEKEALIQRLKECGSDIVKRWDSPLWSKHLHTAEFIHRLRKLIE